MGPFTECGTETGPDVRSYRMFGLEVGPTTVFTAERLRGIHCNWAARSVDFAHKSNNIWPGIGAGLRQKSGQRWTKLRGKWDEFVAL